MARPASLSRRTFLRGFGVSLALPLLDAFAPAARAAQAASQPTRLAFFYVPNGVNIFRWLPESSGRDYQLSPTLAALADHKQDFSILSGLGHPRSQGGHSGADTWLTAADLQGTPGHDYRNTLSIDQAAAEVLGLQTRFPSLELSSSGGTGSAGHSHTLAFSRTGTPLPTLSSPRQLFHRLFVTDTAESREATKRRLAEERSILDAVLGQAKALQRRLGAADRQKMDQYLTSVREVERRVTRARDWVDAPKPVIDERQLPLDERPYDRHDRQSYLRVMFDLIYLAFRTDSTRVCTFQLGREAGGGSFDELGVRAGHHELSHHGGDADMLEQLAKIDHFYLSQLGYFLQRLKETPEQDGTLLDRTMILYGSGMNSGAGGGHSPKNLPLIFAGGRKLGFQLGQHLAYEQDQVPLANLLLTMLQRAGLPHERFADSTGTLTGLV